MNCNNKFNPDPFVQHLQTVIRLDQIQKITDGLDQELMDSQNVLNQIKTMFDSLPKSIDTQTGNNGLKHEDIAEFLTADVPKLLLPDMVQQTDNKNDLDYLIATLKNHVEDIKKNLTHTELKEKHVRRNVENINLEPYAVSLDQVVKQIAKMKLDNTSEGNSNEELELKLSQLCQDVNLFTQMVQTKTKLSETNRTVVNTQQEDVALFYEDMISKLFTGINEVTYLLKE